jgi:hypothetical protein
VIHIWVRTSVDWSDEHAFLAQVRPAFRPNVALWNETFTLPFHVFRDRVRTIARLNLSRVEQSVCEEWDAIPDGALVLPVDDDDWFAPDVGVALELADEAIAYRWPSSFVEVPVDWRQDLALTRWRRRTPTPPRWTCTTNNYALVKRPGVEDLLANHMQASAWFTRHASAVGHVQRRLSSMNRTLASQSSLGALRGTTIRRPALLRKYRRYRRLYRRPVAAELEWCRPYVALMAELMDELELRRTRRARGC